MNAPFIFGVPVGDGHFIGREKEFERLSTNLNFGINTILISPRRWGKTSLVNRVAQKGYKKKIVVKMDIFACRSEYDFYNRFSSELLRQTSSKIDEWKKTAAGFIERLTPKISLAADSSSEYSFSLGITPKTHTPEEILALPQTIAKRKNCDIVICIDEFQQVGEFPDSLSVQKKLRTAWQNHNNVCYCLYGSKMHIMRNLFQKKSYPFYRFGEILNLYPIPVNTWVPYIQERFQKSGKNIDRIYIEKICNICQNQPSYIQQLAYSILMLTDKNVEDDTVNQGVEDIINQNTAAFIEQTENLTTYQMNFLRAIIDGISKGFGEYAIRDRYMLGSSSNIARIKDALINKELIETTENGIFIGDPILRLWLKKIL